jgi:hypothetical protein
MSQFPASAKIFIVLTVVAGLAVLAYGFVHLQPAAPLRLLVFLAAAAAASRLKVKLPGINGAMSVNLPFFLVVAAQLSVPEALVVAGVSSLAQSFGRAGRNQPVQIAFNSALLINAVGLAAVTFTAALERHLSLPLAVGAGTLAYFLANTAPVSVVLWLAEGAKPFSTWRRMADLTLPYYLLSATVAAMVCSGTKNMAWTVPLGLFAVMYLTYRSYRLYFTRSTTETGHTADAAG